MRSDAASVRLVRSLRGPTHLFFVIFFTRIFTWSAQLVVTCAVKAAFHDTDTEILARILADTSDTRIVAIMSACPSFSLPQE